ncbi:MAG: hypothetical protein HQ519_11005 [Planctomycetes bacterium]|nr:hypothetical protein [Planctomycetota bacterium]
MDLAQLTAQVPELLQGLRGCGGAGFPTEFKWQAVRRELGAAANKIILCNADEAEPGTFKDAWLLGGVEARTVIRGMIYAAHFCGAARGWIYLRAEYSAQREHLQQVIAKMEAEGLLSAGSGEISYGAGFPGRKIEAHNCGASDAELSTLDWHLKHGAITAIEPQQVDEIGGPGPKRHCGEIEAATSTGLKFQLGICVSGGAYICGEETALLESMEGRRPQPRHKPPFPTQSGLWGLPTLINNVETFWWAARRLEGSADDFSRRLYSVSGCVQKPGVYEAPLGISARKLIDDHADGLLPGATVSCFTPGGAATGILPPQLLDLPLTQDDLRAQGSSLGTCGLIVHQISPQKAAAKIMRFFAQESCSQCTPCRQGCAVFADWLDGKLQWNDPEVHADWLHAMTAGSICGLGQAAPMTIKMLERF